MNEDFGEAWASYLTFCRTSGNKNFAETIQAAGLENPFAQDSLKTLMDWLQTQL